MNNLEQWMLELKEKLKTNQSKRDEEWGLLANQVVGGETAIFPMKFKTCKCGNLIVLAHGEDECAVCYLKSKGLWRETHPQRVSRRDV